MACGAAGPSPQERDAVTAARGGLGTRVLRRGGRDGARRVVLLGKLGVDLLCVILGQLHGRTKALGEAGTANVAEINPKICS